MFIEHSSIRLGARRTEALILSFALLTGMVPQSPWRGRLWFQLHRPQAELELRPQDQTVEWLRQHFPLSRDCYVLSDSLTRFAIETYFGQELDVARTGIYSLTRALDNLPELESFLQKKHPCGVLVATRERQLVPSGRSAVGSLSGHWTSETTDLLWQVSPGFERSTEALLLKGWTREFVPPYYWLYRPGGTARGPGGKI